MGSKNHFCWLESLFDDFPDEKKNPIEDDFLRIQNPQSHIKPVMGKIGASKNQSFTSCGGKCDRLCNFFRGVCRIKSVARSFWDYVPNTY